MRPRAASSLAAFSDRRLLERLAEGLALLAEHVHKLESSVQVLERDRQIGGAVPLRALAEEEAAKFLILIDVVRCPRKPQQLRVRQLDRFHNHLAKGLYVEVYDGSPANYEEVRRYVDMLRKSHYLDGPNDVDWVFRNSVIATREERLYVDYVEDDDGTRWHSPSSWDEIGLRYRSAVISLVAAMERAGFASVAGLGFVAPLWRDLELTDSLHRQVIRDLNKRTLEAFQEAGITERASADDLHEIVESWSFPLHSMDLSILEVDMDTLREAQRAWVAEW